MNNLVRGILGIVGFMSLLIAANLWFNLDAAVSQLGISPQGGVGRATVRADIAGLFLGIGLLALIAAWRQSSAFASAAMVVAGAALAGRVVSLAVDGTHAGVWPPIIIEIVAIAIFAWGRSIWSGKR